MKSCKFILLFAATVLLIASCTKKKEKDNDTENIESILIFRYPGFVPEPDYRFYRITNDKVLEDTGRKFPSDQANYNYQLPAKNLAIAKTLFNIPSQMFLENGKFYRDGMIADCGGFNVTVYRDGKEYNWQIEDCYLDMPDYVKQYAEKLDNACNEFKK